MNKGFRAGMRNFLLCQQSVAFCAPCRPLCIVRAQSAQALSRRRAVEPRMEHGTHTEQKVIGPETGKSVSIRVSSVASASFRFIATSESRSSTLDGGVPRCVGSGFPLRGFPNLNRANGCDQKWREGGTARAASRRAAQSGPPISWTASPSHWSRPLCAGWFGRSATKPTSSSDRHFRSHSSDKPRQSHFAGCGDPSRWTN